MKAPMISLHSEYVSDIFNGRKNLELRTWIPKGYKGPVYIYCTKRTPLYFIKPLRRWSTNKAYKNKAGVSDWSGKVVAKFWFDDYDTYAIEKPKNTLITLLLKDGTLSMDINTEINLETKSCLKIENIYKYAKPNPKCPDKQRWVYAWHIKQLEIFDKPKQLGEFVLMNKHYKLTTFGGWNDEYSLPQYIPLKKPPQKMVWVIHLITSTWLEVQLEKDKEWKPRESIM